MVLQKLANYEDARVRLTDNQTKELAPAAKNKTGTTLRITKNNFQDEELPHELFLIIRTKTKLRDAFANDILTDIRLSKAQLSSIIWSGWFQSAFLPKVACQLIKLAVPLAKNVLTLLATMTSDFAIHSAI